MNEVHKFIKKELLDAAYNFGAYTICDKGFHEYMKYPLIIKKLTVLPIQELREVLEELSKISINDDCLGENFVVSVLEEVFEHLSEEDKDILLESSEILSEIY